jgi:CDP-diglyceride synthetase
MPLFITWLLLLFIMIYLLILTGEWIANRSFKKILPELLLLSGFVLLLHLTTGFPSAASRQSFGGGVSPLAALGLMFVCTMLGIMAHYILYLKGKFSWKNFLKPLVVSPIVFLPLIGAVQSVSGLESIQMITFAILAFQNGFFWKEVLSNAKEKI